jgi:hypothetical protein
VGCGLILASHLSLPLRAFKALALAWVLLQASRLLQGKPEAFKAILGLWPRGWQGLSCPWLALSELL